MNWFMKSMYVRALKKAAQVSNLSIPAMCLVQQFPAVANHLQTPCPVQSEEQTAALHTVQRPAFNTAEQASLAVASCPALLKINHPFFPGYIPKG